MSSALVAFFKQRPRQIRKLRDVVEALRRTNDSVEVAADARPPPPPRSSPRDRCEPPRPRASRAAPILRYSATSAGSSGLRADISFGITAFSPSAAFCDRNPQEKLICDHAAFLRQRADHVVGHVAAARRQRAARRVRCEDRRRAHFQRIPEGLVGDVRDVHHHAQPVHLAHHVLAEIRQPVVVLMPGLSMSPDESAQSLVLTCVRVM